jgi:peptidylprolyl isomerase
MNKYLHMSAVALVFLGAASGCKSQSETPPAAPTVTTAVATPAPATTTSAVTPTTTPAAKDAPATTAKAKSAEPKTITLPDGLKYQDLKVGTGASPTAGQTVTVNYVGTLDDGTVFDASANHPPGTFDFQIGEGQVIKGWDEGVMTMKIGGKRKLIIPSSLGYGPNGAPPVIPPNATLTFVIDLIATK